MIYAEKKFDAIKKHFNWRKQTKRKDIINDMINRLKTILKQGENVKNEQNQQI
jgi:hypothetical protein